MAANARALTASLDKCIRPRYLYLRAKGMDVPGVGSMVCRTPEVWAGQRKVDLKAYEEWCAQTNYGLGWEGGK